MTIESEGSSQDSTEMGLPDSDLVNPQTQIKRLMGWLAFCYGIVLVQGLATASSVGTWYQTILKPDFTPPNWVFGPVWLTLYGMMAVSAWRVHKKLGPRESFFKHPGLQMFLLQITLNALWSPLFFSWHLILPALVDIIGLWFAILWTIKRFWTTDKLAAYLLMPYLLWVSYATALNTAIWMLNR